MECVHCKGKLKQSQAPFTVERADYQIYWNALPAYVCTQCGEPAFEEKALEFIEKAIVSFENDTAKIAV